MPVERTKNSRAISLPVSDFAKTQLPPRRNDTGLMFSTDGHSTTRLDDKLLKRQDIALEEGDAEPLKGPDEVGTGKIDDEVIVLSELIDKLNERFGTDFTQADEVYFTSLAITASEKQDLRDYAFANALDNFELVFERQFKQLLLERNEKNDAIRSRVLQSNDFYRAVVKELSKRTYNRIRESAGH